jgi:hypothetical protein
VAPSYVFEAELWLYPGEAGWHFLTLPPDVADDIADRDPGNKGFGSVQVTADIGGHTWRTSLFPDKKAGSYLLPVKKPVRTKAGIRAGDCVEVRLELRPDSAPEDAPDNPPRSV